MRWWPICSWNRELRGQTKFSRVWAYTPFLGLVPRQSGTGGKVRLLGISKRGDTYLRSLLAHGARAVVNFQITNRSPWIDKLRSRRPHNVVVIALANKIARTIWTLLAKNRQYDPNYSPKVGAAA